MVHTTTLVMVGDEKFVIPGSSYPGGPGPWVLNEDGSYMLDESGNRIPVE